MSVEIGHMMIEKIFDDDIDDIIVSSNTVYDSDSDSEYSESEEIEDDEKINVKLNVQIGKNQEEMEFNLKLPKSILMTISKFINK
jgi:hypothetical protein